MKDNSITISQIHREWRETNKTIDDIAQMKWQCNVSYKRISNIVYRRKTDLKNDFERQVKKLFTEKFLQFQDVQKAILYTYNNQPERLYSKRSIRRILKIKKQ
jgi:hypothetical protein